MFFKFEEYKAVKNLYGNYKQLEKEVEFLTASGKAISYHQAGVFTPGFL